MNKNHAYALSALVLFCADFLVIDVLQGRSLSALTPSLLLLLSAILLTRWPLIGALGICAVIGASATTAIGNGIPFSGLLVMLALAELIAQKRYWPYAVLAVGTIASIHIGASWPVPPIQRLTSLSIQSCLGVGMGTFLYTNRKKIEQLEEEIHTIAVSTRADIASYIHDSVMTDLAAIIMTARELHNLHPHSADSPHADDMARGIATIEDKAVQASTYLRQVFTNAEGGQTKQNLSLGDVIREGQEILTRGDHSLTIDLPHRSYLDKALNQRATEFLCTFLREGFINCTKYAPHGSDISLWAETTHHHLEIALVSPCAHLSESETETALSSGLGIASLYEKAQTLDLDVLIGPANGTWFHSVRIPIFQASPEDKDEP